MDSINIHENGPGFTLVRHTLIIVSFLVGIGGNIIALWILYTSKNSKHVLMLQCLVTNDLVAEVGMLLVMYLQNYKVIPLYWICVLYVCLRSFGLGSGCVAFVMAIDRWLALTRPFFYQQVITLAVVKKAIFSLWLFGLILSHLPLFGFGQYYTNDQCARYREATEYTDIIYAYLFLIFGTTLCAFIAICNTIVFCTLAGISRKKKKMLVRRVSRSTFSRVNSNQVIITNEELAFAKLMAILCIIFVTCWLPQMIAIPLAQLIPKSHEYHVISKVADFLLCIYFTLDPYIYVLHQYLEKRKFKWSCFKKPTRNVQLSNTQEDSPIQCNIITQTTTN